eukprot:TRINITY_DN3453_c0_g1_i4.p1 TRINITY_DN3453_c0_g1~~TRINITY_DN3453_c0_g1_i4.p1  ORF type:complete len:564 (+),score=108.41 TRINITY_DN3453_c0_g1_i4:333-2024(+)
MSGRNNNRGKHRQGIKQNNGGGGAFSRFTQKHKEKDDDEDMGEGSNRRQQRKDTHRIMVTGFPTETKKETLLTCLQNALKIPLTPVQFSIDNKHAVLHVNKKLEANSLINLSGLQFNGTKLTILSLKGRNPPPQVAENKKEKGKRDKVKEEKMLLEIFVQQIYDHANNALDLSDLQKRIPKIRVDFRTPGFVESLFRILKDKTPAITTINFANNNIGQLFGFDKAKSLGLNILNLSFDTNQIKSVDHVRYLKDLNLRELVLTNNPVSQKTEAFEYRKKISKTLPNLQLIDGYDIKLSSFVPIRSSFCDTPVTQSFADDFVNRFLDLCDKNRSGLVHAYADNAVFSITSYPKNKALAPYAFHDRNLVTKNGYEKRAEHLYVGKQRVVKELCDFPETKHQREGLVVDAFMVKGINTVDLITINMHGDWIEDQGRFRTSYNRTLLLAPAPPNSSALVNGFQAVIINDILHVTIAKKHPIVNNSVNTSTTTVTIPTIAGPSSSPIPVTPNNILIQQQMVIRFSEQTGMNLTFSEQCLTSNQWDYDKSLINFNELKLANSVPPEAFIK